MKKSLFLLLITLILLPSFVYAKDFDPFPESAQAWSWDDVTVFKGATEGWGLHGGIAYHTFVTDKGVSRIRYSYPNGIADLDKSNTYDVSFTIFQPNIQVANLNGFNEGKPIVLLNHNSCNVSYASSSSSTSAIWTQVFSVKCTNMEFGSNDFVVDVITGHAKGDMGIEQANRYGVGWNFDFSVSNHSNAGVEGAIRENTDKIKETNDTIKDSDTSQSEVQANNFFKNFKSDDHGLSGIITAPLSSINKLTQSCVALSLPLPNNVGSIELPCMETLYSNYVPTILSLWHVVIYGLLGYWIYKDIYRIVSNIKNPDDDKVEVLDL